MEWIVYCLGAYIVGSIPFGQIISKRVADIDITKHGSGNIGATNVAREVGIKWGILTLLLDMLKGLLPVLFSMMQETAGEVPGLTGPAVVGLFALAGHQFSCFKRFHGGKGVATALGVYLVIAPVATALALVVFLLIAAKWRYVSLASMGATVSIAGMLSVFGEVGGVIVVAWVMAFLICVKHQENIGRLIRGEERKWKERNVTR